MEAGTVAHRPQTTSCTPALTSAPRPQSLPVPPAASRDLKEKRALDSQGSPEALRLATCCLSHSVALLTARTQPPCTTSKTTRPPGLQVPRTLRFLLHASGGNKRQETLPRTWVPLLQDDLCPFRV